MAYYAQGGQYQQGGYQQGGYQQGGYQQPQGGQGQYYQTQYQQYQQPSQHYGGYGGYFQQNVFGVQAWQVKSSYNKSGSDNNKTIVKTRCIKTIIVFYNVTDTELIDLKRQ